MDKEKCGKFIVELRKEKDISQYKLADMIPIDRTAVSKWERGINFPDYASLERLCEIFEVTPNEILYGERKTKENADKLKQIPIEIMKEDHKKFKKYQKIFIGLIITIFVLAFGFLSYYFINSYNSIKVYIATSNSPETLNVKNGIFIISKRKMYLEIGEIELNNETYVGNVTLYSQIDDKKEILYEGDSSVIIIDLYGYNEYFDFDNIDKTLNNTYIMIEKDNKQYSVKIDFVRDFVNDNFLFNKTEPEIITEDGYEESVHDIPKYIKDNFKYDKKENKYYYESKNLNMYYLPTGNTFWAEENNNNKVYNWLYLLGNNYLSLDINNKIEFSEVDITKEPNNEYVKYFKEKFIDKYLK
ncbi:MAG: helix-turn-helix transcriptional regulator [Bacilli bacterium]|nr:helix-turn-helix transcriptional regulator [Bacilli bacterium]